MKATAKQLLGLLLVFAFLTATGANLPQGAEKTRAITETATDSADSTNDTAADSTSDSAVDVDTNADSSADTATDTTTETATDTVDDTSADSIADTVVDTTADTAAVTSDSVTDSTLKSSSDTSHIADSSEPPTATETTEAQDTLNSIDEPDTATSATDITPEPPVKLSPREQAEKHYQSALDYAKDPSKSIEVVGELTLAIQSDPKYAPAYRKLGIHHYRNKNYKGAEENLKKAAELTPTDTTTLSALGKLYIALRKQEEAEKVFLAAIDADKNYIGGYRELGDLYYRQKRYDESIDALEEYNDVVSDDPLAHFRAGKAYRKLKKYDDAIEEYQVALSIDEEFAPAYSALGQIYLAEERFDDAVDAYTKSVHYNPKGYRSYFNLAIAIQSSRPDSLDQSLAAWRHALRMAKNNPRVTDVVPIAEIQIKELEKQIALRSENSRPSDGE